MNGSTSDSEALAPRSSAPTEQQLTEQSVRGSLSRFEIDDWRTSFGVVAGITARGEPTNPSDFALGPTPGVQVLDRWALLQTECGARGAVVSRQVHAKEVAWHSVRDGLSILDGHDGHGTSDPGLVLAITVADCIPVYLLDSVTRGIVLLHAGWRGTAAGVLSSGIELLKRRAGSHVENIVMHCGVGICGLCYEVGSEVVEAVCGRKERADTCRLDLRGELTRRARAAGIRRCTVSSLCTNHHRDAFFSHRASAGSDGRMVAYMLLLP